MRSSLLPTPYSLLSTPSLKPRTRYLNQFKTDKRVSKSDVNLGGLFLLSNKTPV
ncbi:MAG: hypothetical protein F6J94_12740 [Moorea sp. SIO1F2]|uniref:hypothetical protein n=1 Tax=unclassified Moorena TaxID=2683338 RepID=UPI0013B7F403|nr:MULTISPECIES: hypothetical protein [unclassified Moorena]NEN96098.1 hypothetical protein [Moorena sp. SIO3I7]NEO22296.1 hypothetical protein [Moorena sp. SIO4A5]NEO08295.1 hypothetical protein [Moorena sp. SIO3I8]NEP23747.1 hypothetical protein [Moorena sp. SIO3I6]NEQ57138.1 hypothetical protein [Moorena sp. SIO4A1]